jgi:hypothetical protein
LKAKKDFDVEIISVTIHDEVDESESNGSDHDKSKESGENHTPSQDNEDAEGEVVHAVAPRIHGIIGHALLELNEGTEFDDDSILPIFFEDEYGRQSNLIMYRVGDSYDERRKKKKIVRKLVKNRELSSGKNTDANKLEGSHHSEEDNGSNHSEEDNGSNHSDDQVDIFDHEMTDDNPIFLSFSIARKNEQVLSDGKLDNFIKKKALDFAEKHGDEEPRQNLNTYAFSSGIKLVYLGDAPAPVDEDGESEKSPEDVDLLPDDILEKYTTLANFPLHKGDEEGHKKAQDLIHGRMSEEVKGHLLKFDSPYVIKIFVGGYEEPEEEENDKDILLYLKNGSADENEIFNVLVVKKGFQEIEVTVPKEFEEEVTKAVQADAHAKIRVLFYDEDESDEENGDHVASDPILTAVSLEGQALPDGDELKEDEIPMFTSKYYEYVLGEEKELSEDNQHKLSQYAEIHGAEFVSMDDLKELDEKVGDRDANEVITNDDTKNLILMIRVDGLEEEPDDESNDRKLKKANRKLAAAKILEKMRAQRLVLV